MTTAEARNLKAGDPVITFNGPYQQNGTVESVEAHHRAGYWIRYYWRNPKGQTLEGRKRHTSVYLPNK